MIKDVCYFVEIVFFLNSETFDINYKEKKEGYG